jgi:hypothetical protein
MKKDSEGVVMESQETEGEWVTAGVDVRQQEISL